MHKIALAHNSSKNLALYPMGIYVDKDNDSLFVYVTYVMFGGRGNRESWGSGNDKAPGPPKK